MIRKTFKGGDIVILPRQTGVVRVSYFFDNNHKIPLETLHLLEHLILNSNKYLKCLGVYLDKTEFHNYLNGKVVGSGFQIQFKCIPEDVGTMINITQEILSESSFVNDLHQLDFEKTTLKNESEYTSKDDYLLNMAELLYQDTENDQTHYFDRSFDLENIDLEKASLLYDNIIRKNKVHVSFSGDIEKSIIYSSTLEIEKFLDNRGEVHNGMNFLYRPIKKDFKAFRGSGQEPSNILTIMLLPAPFRYSYSMYVFLSSFIAENLNDFVRFKDNTDYSIYNIYRMTRYGLQMVFEFNSTRSYSFLKNMFQTCFDSNKESFEMMKITISKQYYMIYDNYDTTFYHINTSRLFPGNELLTNRELSELVKTITYEEFMEFYRYAMDYLCIIKPPKNMSDM